MVSVDPKASGIISSSALKSIAISEETPRRQLPAHQRKVPCHFWPRGKRSRWARGHRPQAGYVRTHRQYYRAWEGILRREARIIQSQHH